MDEITIPARDIEEGRLSEEQVVVDAKELLEKVREIAENGLTIEIK